MSEENYDLLVVGGGINGAAVARDAAGRGFRVLLAEAGDFAGETSSASSKLIHGGLRYLEHLEFGLVYEGLREREILLRTAGRLVRPIRFLVPIRKGGPRPAWFVGLGLWLYQLLARSSLLEKTGSLTKAEAAAIPHLKLAQLSRIFHYPDCQVDDARLTLELVMDARARGALVENYTEVTALQSANSGFVVTLESAEQKRTVRARHVVNTAGTHVNEVLDLYRGHSRPRKRPLKLVKGSHIVLPLKDFGRGDAFTLSNRDGRVIFVIPWLDHYRLIGTTDAPQRADEPVVCSDEERLYLLRAYSEFFDDQVAEEDVLWSFAGVRALAYGGRKDPSKVTRDYRLSEFRPRRGRSTLLSVYGGKLTTHRALAERVVSRLQRLDGKKAARPGKGWTASAPLVGSEEVSIRQNGIEAEILDRWSANYGRRMADYFGGLDDPATALHQVVTGVPEVELAYAWDVELARRAEDFVARRSKLVLTLNEAEITSIESWFERRRAEDAQAKQV